MKKVLIMAVFLPVAFVAGCNTASSSQTPKQLADEIIEPQDKCTKQGDGAACDEVLAVIDRNLPILKGKCNSGDQEACGLAAGLDFLPALIKNYKATCINNEVSPSVPDNLRKITQEAMKAGCQSAASKGQ